MTKHDDPWPKNPPPAVVEAAVELLGAAGGTARLHVSGASMAPLLRQGDVVVVRLGQAQPRLGDLVVRRQGGALVVHRVVGVTREHVMTKGDATLSPDPPATPDEILGVVTAIEGISSADLSRGAWRVLNPALAAYSLLVAHIWWMLSGLRRGLLRGRSPLALRLTGRALQFVLKAPLRLIASLTRQV